MFSLRAPSNTCLSGLAQGRNGTMDAPLNHSKGCGGVMRVAPIGLYFADKGRPVGEADILAAQTAVLTHGHPMGYIPAAVLAHIVLRLAQGGSFVPEAVGDALDATGGLFPQAGPLLALLQKAVELADGPMPDAEAIPILGEGWYGDEALAIGIFCALRHRDSFENAVIAAVNHDGGSDSTGSITGNILGAALGRATIPERFTASLELRDVISTLAEDLCRDALWESKYLSATYPAK